MGSSENFGEVSPSAVGETVSMGEAAKMLGLSVATVQRMCRDYEADHTKGLPFHWTSPTTGRTDRHGRRLRGHRRAYRAAVLRMVQEMHGPTPGDGGSLHS